MHGNILAIVILLMFLISIVFAIPTMNSASTALHCFHQKSGWDFWDDGKCKNPENVCVKIKKCPINDGRIRGGVVVIPVVIEVCPIGELHINGDHMEEVYHMKEMEKDDEVRGCARRDFCETKKLAGCDCQICDSDYCNAALGHQKMSISGGIMMLALAMISICGFLGHLFVPQNLLMMIGGMLEFDE